MKSIYFFEISEKNEYKNEDLPQSVLNHCKKKESFAAAQALLDMGVQNLRYEETGKPVADNCFVSISHSGDMVAVCTSDKPVGIDIELIDTRRDFTKISKRVFCGKEHGLFEKSPTAELFYEIWTKKEAYSKINGNGTIEIMKGFDIFDLEDYEFQTEIINNYILSTCEKIK